MKPPPRLPIISLNALEVRQRRLADPDSAISSDSTSEIA